MGRVVILDLEGDLGPPLARLIESRGHQTKLASTPQAATRETTATPTDLLILNLPPSGGYDADALSALQVGDTPVLTLHAGPSPAPPASSQRRNFHLAKPFRSNDLLDAVDSLCRLKNPPAPADPTPRLPPGFSSDPSGSRLYFQGQELVLTPTEFSLLSYLLRHPGQVVSHDELLTNVWGFAPGSGGRDLLRAHLSNLRDKLPSQARGLLRTVPGRGYLLADA